MKNIYSYFMLCVLLFPLSHCVLDGFASNSVGGLLVSRVTPGGHEVTGLHQIVVEFNKPISSLGEAKPKLDQIGIEINPKVQCEWSWLNESSLACNLDEKNALSLATRYEVIVESKLAAKDGSRLAKSFKHEFTTQLPNVEYAYLEQWKSPARPLLHVWTNQPIAKADLEKSLIIAFRETGKSASLVNVLDVENGSDREWLVEPVGDLPKDAELTLQLVPGLGSKLGPEKSSETRQLSAFDTFADFAFVGVECTTNQGNPAAPGESCSAESAINLLFNAPVSRGEILKFVSVSPEIINRKEIEEELSYDEAYQLRSNHTKTDFYKIALPGMGPSSKYKLSWKSLGNQKGPKDMFGREITALFPLEISTDKLLPNLSLPYAHAVLEKNENSDVIIKSTNLKSWDFRFFGLDTSGPIKDQTYHEVAPPLLNKRVSVPLKIREKLKNRSGVLLGKLTTDPLLNEKYPQDRRLFAQVTPYQVHVKLGHFSSLVWVTDLKTGEVVKNARVRIYKDSFASLSASPKSFAEGKTDGDGIAVLSGTNFIDPKLSLVYGYKPDREMLFVRVDKGEDMALLPLDYDYEVSIWRASNGSLGDNMRQKDGHIVTFGTTAQGVYRLGDKIQYKIYVRAQNNERLIPAETNGYRLRVNDPMGKTVFENLDVKLSKFGALDGEILIPKNGTVGWYQFELVKKAGESPVYYPMNVLVSDFTPSPFRVTQDLSSDSFHAGDHVTVRTQAKLHSGGGFSGATGKITATVESGYFSPKTALTKDFEFSSAENGQRLQEVFQSDFVLDPNGENESRFRLPELKIYYGELKIESSVMDDRGKSIAAQNQAPYASVDRFVGVKRTQWDANTKKPVSFQYLVSDMKGALVEDTPVHIEVEREKKTISRIKDVGSTYSTHVTTAFEFHSNCDGISSKEPLSCEFNIARAGIYRLTAKIKDTKNKEHMTRLSFWVSGEEPIIWDEKNGEFLEIEAEKKEVSVGEKARFMVKNPYGNAKALITIERYGVIDRFVKNFTKSAEIIEIPVKDSYLPGFYLSVIIQSERVGKAKVTGQLDLGKPTFSMGYIDVAVTDRYKEIVVAAKVENEVYRPREKVKVRFNAKPKTPNGKNEPIELAIAVIDESVFDLLSGGNDNYDPYKGLYRFDSLDLRNFSLLTRLVGRQKLEAKGANPGGGGGVDVAMRSVFKYVSYFNPSVVTDSFGNAVVEFDAPDNLTGWRVLAMAVTPSDRAGLGIAKFKVNRPTEVRPVMPNQVLEGDSFNADFTVMNRTQQKRLLKVKIVALGDVESDNGNALLKEVPLAPFERKTISFPVHAKKLKNDTSVQQGEIEFRVTAGDNEDTDGIVHAIPVAKKRSLQSVAIYGSIAENNAEHIVLFPKDIYTDVGGLEVSLSPSVISSIEGAFRYMRDYPHGCFEQRLSKAVMAESFQDLKKYIDGGFSWAGSDKLPQETLDVASEFQAPNGGMCYFGSSDAHADPYLSAYTALAFQWLKRSGKSVPVNVERDLHSYLDNFLRRDVSPEYYSKGMTASVRATALLALALGGKSTLADISRYKGQFEQMSLMGKAQLVEAALNTQGANAVATELMNKLLAKKTESAGKILFSETSEGGFERILSTPIRNNCAALSALTAYSEKNGEASVKDHAFKLVRSISETRKSKDHFENTQENMFCMKALSDYSKVYEKQPTNMKVEVRLDEDNIGKASFESKTTASQMLKRAIKKTDPGKKATVQIERSGEGRLYYSTILKTGSSKAEIEAMNAGIDLKREYSILSNKKWTVLKTPMRVKRGDVVRVDLFLSVPRAGNFVVVNDPIPGGLEALNQDLATTSLVDLESGYQPSEGSAYAVSTGIREFSDSYFGFYHKELHKDSARFYSDYLPAGSYRLSYTAQAIAEGRFTSVGPKAEEMYNPDVFGRDKSVSLTVGAK